jgi:hypothetical protein
MSQYIYLLVKAYSVNCEQRQEVKRIKVNKAQRAASSWAPSVRAIQFTFQMVLIELNASFLGQGKLSRF